MADEDRGRSRKRWRGRGGGGCGFGCGTFFFVLIVGGLLSLFSADLSIGASVRVPFTPDNITLAGSIGSKQNVVSALPPYTQGRVASNQDFINGTQALTIWPAEGVTVFIVGKQDGAPAIDLHVVMK